MSSCNTRKAAARDESGTPVRAERDARRGVYRDTRDERGTGGGGCVPDGEDGEEDEEGERSLSEERGVGDGRDDSDDVGCDGGPGAVDDVCIGGVTLLIVTLDDANPLLWGKTWQGVERCVMTAIDTGIGTSIGDTLIRLPSFAVPLDGKPGRDAEE